MAQRPNILHIFTDQQRWDTLAALGNPVIRTPSLDRLAAMGTAFTSAYSPSPVCISARCSMIYGQYPSHTGCYENTRMPEDGRESFMGALTRCGYRTHGVGKCHFTPDSYALRGFQTREYMEEIVDDPGRDDYLKMLQANGFAHVCDPHGVRGEMYYLPQPSQLPARLHPTQWVGDRACAFIGVQNKISQPWYLYTGFVHPHPPFAPPNPWHKLYRAFNMPLPNVPPDAAALLTYINKRQNRYKYRDRGIDTNLLRCLKAYYYACISFVDFQVGRMLDALTAAGQLDNTLIIYTADHGEHLGDYNCFGKRTFHDSCARVPLLVSLPGRFTAGARCDTPTSLVDIAPTLLGATGVSLSSHRPDGEDLAVVAAGDAPRTHVFGQLAWCGAAAAPAERAACSLYFAVGAGWKYAYSALDQREFLFNRSNDPRETVNCAGQTASRQALDGIKTQVFNHLRAQGETAGLDGNAWQPFPRREMPSDPDAGLIVQDHPWANQEIPGYSDGRRIVLSWKW
jgi:arylsulfatase A-like enzyme